MKPRFATRDDLIQWFGSVPSTMRALVLEEAGEVKAIAGVARQADHMQAFSAYKPEMRQNPVALGRLAVAFKRLLVKAGPVFALCADTEPTSPGLLTHLGFEPVSDKVWRHG